jgi:transcriptional regulator with XRE-family HTH domain
MSGKKGIKTEIERFLFVCRESELSQTPFDVSLGSFKSQVNHILSGRTKPSREALDTLASKYNANINWFLSGLGSPYGNKRSALVEMVNQEKSVGRGVVIEDYVGKTTIPGPQAVIYPYNLINAGRFSCPVIPLSAKKSTKVTSLSSSFSLLG